MVTYHIEKEDNYGITQQYLWTFPKKSDENIQKIATKFLRRDARRGVRIYLVLPKSQTGLQKMEYVGSVSYAWGAQHRPSKVWGFYKHDAPVLSAYHIWDSKSKKLVMIPYKEFFDKYVE